MKQLFVTSGKRVWWVSDELQEIHDLRIPPEALLYRDEPRLGGYYPEENLSPELVQELTLLFEEQEER